MGCTNSTATKHDRLNSEFSLDMPSNQIEETGKELAIAEKGPRKSSTPFTSQSVILEPSSDAHYYYSADESSNLRNPFNSPSDESIVLPLRTCSGRELPRMDGPNTPLLQETNGIPSSDRPDFFSALFPLVLSPLLADHTLSRDGDSAPAANPFALPPRANLETLSYSLSENLWEELKESSAEGNPHESLQKKPPSIQWGAPNSTLPIVVDIGSGSSLRANTSTRFHFPLEDDEYPVVFQWIDTGFPSFVRAPRRESERSELSELELTQVGGHELGVTIDRFAT
jgi:hypothetical protein